MKSYSNPVFDYRPCADQHTGTPARHPIVVIGAGPVGLVTAIDLAVQGQAVVVLDDDQTVSVGSRAVCHAKRTLEILDRLGCGQPRKFRRALVADRLAFHTLERAPINPTEFETGLDGVCAGDALLVVAGGHLNIVEP